MLANQNKRLSSVRLAEEKECEIRIYECAKAATRVVGGTFRKFGSASRW